MNKNSVLRTAALALACTTTGVLAHDTQAHAKAREFDATKVEETPFGQEGDPKSATRVINVGMADTMRFTPSQITVQRGETVKLVATNNCQVLHELVLGTPEELKEHAEMMKRFPGMEHDEPHMAHVKQARPAKSSGSSPRRGSSSSPALSPATLKPAWSAR